MSVFKNEVYSYCNSIPACSKHSNHRVKIWFFTINTPFTFTLHIITGSFEIAPANESRKCSPDTKRLLMKTVDSSEQTLEWKWGNESKYHILDFELLRKIMSHERAITSARFINGYVASIEWELQMQRNGERDVKTMAVAGNISNSSQIFESIRHSVWCLSCNQRMCVYLFVSFISWMCVCAFAGIAFFALMLRNDGLAALRSCAVEFRNPSATLKSEKWLPPHTHTKSTTPKN